MRYFLIFLIVMLLPGIAWAGTQPVLLGDEAVRRLPEVAVLFSVFTRQAELDGITPEMVGGIVLSQFPDLWNGDVARMLEQRERVILGVEKPPEKPMEDGYLADFGRDLDERDRKNMKASGRVIVCGYRGEAAAGKAAGVAALLACAIAQRVEGTILDPATLECFSPRAFHALRLGEMRGRLISRLITRPGVAVQGFCRLASRGMHTAGLPDLVLTEVPEDRMQEAHLLIMAVALSLDRFVEQCSRETMLRIGARELHRVIRPGQRLPVDVDADATLAVGLVHEPRQEFDDRNRHLRLIDHENPEQSSSGMLRRLFPVEEPVFDYLKLTDLQGVARRAQADIPGLVDRFRLQRPDEEFFLLIVPPLASEADNLVWVRVARLDSVERLSGVVMPDQLGRSLRAGDAVDFTATSVFDWMVLKKGELLGGNYLQQYLEELKKKKR